VTQIKCFLKGAPVGVGFDVGRGCRRGWLRAYRKKKGETKIKCFSKGCAVRVKDDVGWGCRGGWLRV